MGSLFFILSYLLKWNHAVMIIKAHLDYYKHKRGMLEKRGQSNKLNSYFHCKNIVFKYFVGKKRKFSEIN